MKAVQVLGDSSSPKIVLNQSATKPVPQKADILVKVHAAAITSDELKWPELYNHPNRIPGHDVSGVVAAFGPDYDGSLKIGDEVFLFLHAERGEGQAEFTICSADEVAIKPKSISHAEAAALPIPLLTAWEAITDHVRLTSGTKVLVTGASGAVGAVFVQLATHLAGAKVTALASTQHHDHLRQLGASEVLDYKTPNWEQLVANIDVVFDTVGGDVLTKSWKTVTDTGKIVTIADPAPSWAFGEDKPVESTDHPHVTYKYFIVIANADRLSEASKLVDNGSVRPLAIKTFPFEEAEQAWSYAQERGRGHKVVIDFTGA